MKILVTIFVLFFSSCSNNDVNQTFERTAVIYNGLVEKKEEKFTANVSSKEIRLYKYVSQIDSTKIIEIKFDKRSKVLFFGPNEFILSDRMGFKEEKLSQDLFDYYYLKDPITDGSGPILYNDDYGLLAINNVFGPTIILLNEDTIDFKNQILISLYK
jgi:hypothetical protein